MLSAIIMALVLLSTMILLVPSIYRVLRLLFEATKKVVQSTHSVSCVFLLFRGAHSVPFGPLRAHGSVVAFHVAN